MGKLDGTCRVVRLRVQWKVLVVSFRVGPARFPQQQPPGNGEKEAERRGNKMRMSLSLSTARHYAVPHSEGQFLIVDARASDGLSEKRDYHGRANKMILGYLSFSVGGW